MGSPVIDLPSFPSGTAPNRSIMSVRVAPNAHALLGGKVMRAAAVQKRPPVTRFVSKFRSSANIGTGGVAEFATVPLVVQ